MDKKDIAEELFVSVQTEKGASGPVLTSEDLTLLMVSTETEEEAINVFCAKHHSVFPISRKGREELISRSGTDAPADWTGKYFEVSGCPFCTADFKYENPILKDFRN